MKLYILFFSVCFLILGQHVTAQIIDPKKSAERKTTDRANSKIDKGIDDGLDKLEGVFKKKDKKAKKGNAKSDSTNDDAAPSNQSTAPAESGDAAVGKNGSVTNKAGNTQMPAKTQFKTNSKFDFVSGEKVIAYDDFSTTNVGDFPLGWNTSSSAELVSIDDSGQKWLFMSQDGFAQPTYVTNMPENFTLEFEMFNRYSSSNILAYSFMFYESENPRRDLGERYPAKSSFQFSWLAGTGEAKYYIYENGEEVGKNESLNVKDLKYTDNYVKAKFSIWRQKTRLRIYINEDKVLDLPQAFDPKAKYNVFKLGGKYMNFSTRDDKDEFMVSEMRYAVGSPDMRSKLITDGKLVTRGITFDVGSDVIKPESFGVLKEIAKVLAENPTVKVKIVGHTDSDGSAAANIELSKKRGEAVKNVLSTDFSIDAARMQSDGKGAAEPSEPNTTPQGKANNRRVEFIKL